MANYKEYRIAVDNNIVGIEQVNQTSPATRDPAIAKPKEKKDSISKVIAIDMAKKAITFAIQNYGNLNGDYLRQQQINDMVSIGGMLATAATGPVGMAVVGAQVTIAAINRIIDVKKSRVASKMMETRLGIANRGSR